MADAAEKLIVVILAGRPLELADVVERADAVLFCFHPGSGTGPAVVDLLLGDTDPSGRLPVTLPRSVGQVPIYYGRGIPVDRRSREKCSFLTIFRLGRSNIQPANGLPFRR